MSALLPAAGRPVLVAPPRDRTQAERGREIPPCPTNVKPLAADDASVLEIACTLLTLGAAVSGYVGREISAIVAYGISIVGVVAALFISSPD